MMQTFVARFEREGDGGYSVSFPDAPGAITQGDTFAEALANATEALDLWLECRAEHGDATVKELDDDALLDRLIEIGCASDVMAVPIAVSPPSKAVRINVSMDETLIERIDRAAERSGRSRSAFLADAARQALRA